MATTLLGALVALFDGDPSLVAATTDTGGLWVGGIPEDKSALPIVALLPHNEVPGWVAPVKSVQEEGNFSLVVYQNGLAAAEYLAGLERAVRRPPAEP